MTLSEGQSNTLSGEARQKKATKTETAILKSNPAATNGHQAEEARTRNDT
jgi:hypothetical protein